MWIGIGKQRLLQSIRSLAMTLVLISFSTITNAEDIKFEAVVNANKITMQDVLELTLSVQGAKDEVTPPLPVAIDGFDGRYVGPATKFSIINGVSYSERSFLYNYFPSKTGHFSIPSIALIINGKTYQSTPIEVEVLEKPADSTTTSEPAMAQNIEDSVFLTATSEVKKVYVGQKTPLTMKVFVKGQSLQLGSAPYLKPEGFVADATASMHKSKEIVNGMTFDTLTFDTNIYPTRPGDLDLGPFEAVGELVYRIKQNNDIFGDLFAREETRPITLRAPVIRIEVLPLPSEGKPEGFSGSVGQYDFKASVGPATVKLGDPLTLHMTITGQGRIKEVSMPVLSDSRFKTYDPQIKEGDTTKTLEQVIIPTTADLKEVPAFSFSYFDPEQGQYKTITQGPFPITVTPPAAGEEFKAYGFVDKSNPASPKSPALELDGLNKLAAQAIQQGWMIVIQLWFWVVVLVATLAWLGWGIWRKFQERLQKDETFARDWKADAKAKELLKRAKASLQTKNPKEFYSNVYKTLNDYLADKMHQPVASLNWDMIKNHLSAKSVDSAKLEDIKSLFDRCDLARFASADMPVDQMSKDYDQLQAIIHYLPQVLK